MVTSWWGSENLNVSVNLVVYHFSIWKLLSGIHEFSIFWPSRPPSASSKCEKLIIFKPVARCYLFQKVPDPIFDQFLPIFSPFFRPSFFTQTPFYSPGYPQETIPDSTNFYPILDPLFDTNPLILPKVSKIHQHQKKDPNHQFSYFTLFFHQSPNSP